MIPLKELEELAKKSVSKKRFKHIINVCEQAESLGKHYHEDIYQCRLAALLHDMTKELKFESQLQMILKSDIMASDIILKSTPLYHAVTGYIYAKDELGITDINVLNAVRYHTTGRAGMSKLEKIIYIADAISMDRKYKEVARFRELSFVDLDICLLEIIRHTIRYLVKDNCLIPADTLNCYNELIVNLGEIRC